MSKTSVIAGLAVCGLVALANACQDGSFSSGGNVAKKETGKVDPARTTSNSTGTPGNATSGGNPTTGGTGGGNPGASTGNGDPGMTSGATGAGTGTGPSIIEIPSNCSSSGVTQANLLTTDLPNYAVNAVDYTIFLTDCDGTVQTLTSEVISFDVNATAAGIGKGKGLTYEITDAKNGAGLGKGVLAEVKGTDLFGNTGPQYYHYETDKPVSVTSGSQSFKLRITLPAACCAIPDTIDPAGDQLIDSFLRLGKAAPVKKVVHFRAAPPPPAPKE